MTERPLEALVVRAGGRACAVPVAHVMETMRPLPIDELTGMPGFVRGVAVIRGVPTPVVDLHALLGGGAPAVGYGRFVTVRVGARPLALGVDEVVGLRALAAARFAALPPLLAHAGRGVVEALAAEGAELLLLLRLARVVPEEVWGALDAAEEPR